MIRPIDCSHCFCKFADDGHMICCNCTVRRREGYITVKELLERNIGEVIPKIIQEMVSDIKVEENG